MTPELLHRVREIVDTVLDEAPGDRERVLRETCGGDEALLRSVHEMIELEHSAADFLEPPDGGAIDRLLVDLASGEPIGMRIGRYRIMQVLAAGGMGTVYLALRDDEEFEKRVAIKLINRGMNTRQLKERFHRERRLLARLEHPNIASLLDGGATFDDRPYMVMEFVEGIPIDRFCDRRQRTISERLELFLAVCDAVHYAHQHLIIHRDLKPGNVLVTAEGLPKLVDFGISRMLDEDGTHDEVDLTRTGHRAMTPQYASPEQVRGDRITTASDIYSLGVLLYELLTGHRPYQLEALPRYEKEQVICEIEPPRPSQIVLRERAGRSNADEPATITPSLTAQARRTRPEQLKRRLAGDVDNIVLKAMSKSPQRRYSTVQEFAADIRRHLEGQPVSARAGTFTYRSAKFIRRNKTAVAAAAAVLVAMIAGTATALFGLGEARLERNAAVAAKLDADEVSRFLQDTIVGAGPYRAGREVTIEKLLADATARMESELADRPGVQAGVSYAIAQSYAGIWEWKKAATHARKALDLYRRQYGQVNSNVADCLTLYGHAQAFLRHPRSIDALRDALEIRRKLYDETDVRIAESYGYLGFALWRGVDPPRYTEAEAHYREALRRYRALYETPTEDHARFAYSYAAMLTQQRRHTEAGRRFREAIDAFRARPGSAGRYMIECLRSYAQFLQSGQRFEDARQYYREVLALMPGTYADPLLADTCWQLGLVEHATGARREAEKLYQRAIRTEIALTEQHEGAPIGPGDVLASFEVGGSRQLYDDVFRALAAHRPDDFPLVHHFGWVAEFLRHEGRLDEAETLFRRCDEAVTAMYGEEHARTAEMRAHLGMCLADQGRHEEGEALMLESYRRLREHLGEHHPMTRTAAQGLIDLYERTGEPEKARTIRDRAWQS